MTKTKMKNFKFNRNIQERILRSNIRVIEGEKVLVTNKDGTQYVGEIFSIHRRVKNWIIQVKRVHEDGKVTIEEVADLVVDAVILVKDIAISEIFRVAWQWVKNLFVNKAKKRPSIT